MKERNCSINLGVNGNTVFKLILRLRVRKRSKVNDSEEPLAVFMK
jgi:hypothetical protein